jgi:putative ATP-dependent endonuclease of OLD family
MQVAHIHIQNFRGVKEASLFFSQHAVLLGDNNTGKTTVLEALDLTLGPDRLNRTPPIDEHDFYRGQYHTKNVGAVLKGRFTKSEYVGIEVNTYPANETQALATLMPASKA